MIIKIRLKYHHFWAELHNKKFAKYIKTNNTKRLKYHKYHYFKHRGYIHSLNDMLILKKRGKN